MHFDVGREMKEYLNTDRHTFEELLLMEAINVKDKIDEILKIGNIDLLSNAYKLVIFIIDNEEEDLIEFAGKEGVAWAKYSLTLSFKLEWVQAIRRTIWKILHTLSSDAGKPLDIEEYFYLEKKINDQIDQFLNCFFLSYSKYKDELLETQKKLVENLSVPIIPVSSNICVLPIIGTVDFTRAKIMEEKVLNDISRLHIQTLIIDLSGVAELEADIVHQLLNLIDGAAMMGCKTVITGLRPDLVRIMIHMGFSFHEKADVKGSLQQALKDYLIIQV